MHVHTQTIIYLYRHTHVCVYLCKSYCCSFQNLPGSFSVSLRVKTKSLARPIVPYTICHNYFSDISYYTPHLTPLQAYWPCQAQPDTSIPAQVIPLSLCLECSPASDLHDSLLCLLCGEKQRRSFLHLLCSTSVCRSVGKNIWNKH